MKAFLFFSLANLMIAALYLLTVVLHTFRRMFSRLKNQNRQPG